MSNLELILERDEAGTVTLCSPGVGRWLGAPGIGQLAAAGQAFGALEVLGRARTLIVPAGVRGLVAEQVAGAYVAYGDTLAVIGEGVANVGGEVGASADPRATSDGVLVFRSSSSGRFYLRPAPEKPAFVAVGDEIEEGQTVFILEVMKTFSRIAYGGPGLPARAKVTRIAVSDGDDLEAGQVVLELEVVTS